jgi:hypothetical protein
VTVLKGSTLVPDLVFVVTALAYVGFGIVRPALDALRRTQRPDLPN